MEVCPTLKKLHTLIFLTFFVLLNLEFNNSSTWWIFTDLSIRATNRIIKDCSREVGDNFLEVKGVVRLYINIQSFEHLSSNHYLNMEREWVTC